MLRHAVAFCVLASGLLAVDTLDATLLIADHRVPEARLLLERHLAAQPGDVEALLQLGFCQDRMRDYSLAAATLEKAVALAPARTDVQLACGEYSLRAARAERSLSLASQGRHALQEACRLDPRLVAPHEALFAYYIGAPWFAGGSMDKARAEADAIARIDPDRGLAAHVMLLEKQGEAGKAFLLCRTELRLRPSSYTAHFELGRLAAQSSRHLEEGAAALEACLPLAAGRRFADVAGIHLYLGMILRAEGRIAEARKSYERGLAVDPRDERLSSALAALGAH